jgi:hypothetical protein
VSASLKEKPPTLHPKTVDGVSAVSPGPLYSLEVGMHPSEANALPTKLAMDRAVHDSPPWAGFFIAEKGTIDNPIFR